MCKKKRIIYKRFILSIIFFIIGVFIYYLFRKNILTKSNLICTIIRNYLLDSLWSFSFYFFIVDFAENITKKYILLASTFVLVIGIIFEIMQLVNITNGTFDLFDVFSYFIAILIACLIEIKMEVEYEKV